MLKILYAKVSGLKKDMDVIWYIDSQYFFSILYHSNIVAAKCKPISVAHKTLLNVIK